MKTLGQIAFETVPDQTDEYSHDRDQWDLKPQKVKDEWETFARNLVDTANEMKIKETFGVKDIFNSFWIR